MISSLKSIFYVLMFFASSNVIGSQFCFQNNIAEGQVMLYRIDIKNDTDEGSVCLLNTEDFNGYISNEVINKIRGGKLWSDISEFPDQNWGCAKFIIYSYGWFRADPIIIHEGDVTYTLFYVGRIEENSIDGVLYEFRDFAPSGESDVFRSIDKVKLEKISTCNNPK